MRKLFSVIVAAALVLSLIAIPSMAAEDVEVDLSNVDIAKAEFGPHGYDGEFCIMYDYGLIAVWGPTISRIIPKSKLRMLRFEL